MLDLLDVPRSELVDLFLTGRECFLAAGCCRSLQSVVGTARQSMAGLSSAVLVFSMVSSTGTLPAGSLFPPFGFILPLSPCLLPTVLPLDGDHISIWLSRGGRKKGDGHTVTSAARVHATASINEQVLGRRLKMSL